MKPVRELVKKSISGRKFKFLKFLAAISAISIFLQIFRYIEVQYNVFISLYIYWLNDKMFKIMYSRFSFRTQCIVRDSVKRFFLSDAYKCEEIWANRLKNPAFQKVNLNNLYHELDVTFEKNERVNVLDIDLLFNGVDDSAFKNELDDVLLRIRLCPESILLPERITHAALRWYLQNASTEDLLNVLSDRINYGLFPDYYLVNLAMDKYLKEDDTLSAVKIAVLQMLQEDFDHPIMQVLALHCCYNYLESPEIWESLKQPDPDPDEEVTKVRVRYLRNPYFDDHFDITDTNHLVGKTLWLFGRTVDRPIGVSSQLVGLVLYEKYDKCAEFLEGIISKGLKLHSEAVVKAREYSSKKPKQAEEDVSEEKKVETGQADSKTESIDESKNKVVELLEKIDQKNLIKGKLLLESAEVVKQVVQENESKDIEHQCQVYKQWEKDRIDHIQSEIERAERVEIQSKIKQMKEKLQKEEEKLFFFDKEEEIEMLVEEKRKIKSSLVFYKGKGKHREKTLDDYIPPDVSQRKK